MDSETFMYIEAGSEWASSAFHAESKALLKVSSWLSKNILSTVSVVMDCKTLAETINKSCKDSPWTADNTIQEVNSIMKKLPQAQAPTTAPVASPTKSPPPPAPTVIAPTPAPIATTTPTPTLSPASSPGPSIALPSSPPAPPTGAPATTPGGSPVGLSPLANSPAGSTADNKNGAVRVSSIVGSGFVGVIVTSFMFL
ncbi:classical arabinogalactan protein 7-like [Papaver somniferum]|uniref:classical arabinogalactan protein 7-like n=1 Tax=Papaver somniferum TaxID=3469 RepID=UPI000E700266|nr:classical arabinogalactan protein 7-like [Papaver somniferum]